LAYQDGSISQVEKQLLGQFARALKLDPKQAKDFSSLAKREFQEGRNSGQGEADMNRIFLEACRFAASDGEIDAGERSLLESFGRGVGISGERLDQFLARAVQDAVRQAEGEGQVPSMPSPVPAGAPASPQAAPALQAASAPLAAAAASTPSSPASPAAAPASSSLSAPAHPPPLASVTVSSSDEYKVEIDVELPDLDLKFGGI
jgi:DnaJ-domain-containing protein 1